MTVTHQDSPPASRRIFVNGAATQTAAANLRQLLAMMDLAESQAATALNGEFVPAGQRREAQLMAGDRVEIVTPRQGG